LVGLLRAELDLAAASAILAELDRVIADAEVDRLGASLDIGELRIGCLQLDVLLVDDRLVAAFLGIF
jgi:hypothetical protein